MSTALAALIAVAAFTITYFTCVRPMRRGCRPHATAGDTDEFDRHIAELRAELTALRGENRS
jgi:hypothetical protein